MLDHQHHRWLIYKVANQTTLDHQWVNHTNSHTQCAFQHDTLDKYLGQLLQQFNAASNTSWYSNVTPNAASNQSGYSNVTPNAASNQHSTVVLIKNEVATVTQKNKNTGVNGKNKARP